MPNTRLVFLKHIFYFRKIPVEIIVMQSRFPVINYVY